MKKGISKMALNILVAASLFLLVPNYYTFPQNDSASSQNPEYYQPYLKLLEDVYQVMESEYYRPVSRRLYEEYVRRYKHSVLSRLTNRTKRIDMVAYRGAGLMVNALRAPEDKFTNFLPPKKAEEYSQQVYGYKHDIGIEGHLTAGGYIVDKVQIRSDSYAKGLRCGDTILKIDDKTIAGLSEEKIEESLRIPLGETLKLKIFSQARKKALRLKILCKKYFKETVQNIPTEVEGVFCLKIESFNKKTSEDLKRNIKEILAKTELLILDLQDNPGGPPLAVHAISGIFLPPEQKLFYYQKKNKPVFGMFSPSSKVSYDGQLAVIINNKSGSASELFSGTLKAYNRALIIGKNPTAGFAFLKTTRKFEDGSMLSLITGESFLFNGQRISINGVKPNYTVPGDTENILKFILKKYKNGRLPVPDNPFS